LQSVINEGRLKFRDHLNTRGGHASHSQILSKGIINLESKKILVRPSQAETTKSKNVIIGESREKVRPTIKKPKSTFDELWAKYKKDDAYTKNRQNRNVRKVKPELPIFPCQADILVASRRRDSKQPKSFLKVKPHSQDQ
jgi:hypothetical protein